MPETSHLRSRIAGLQAEDEDTPVIVSGVAIAPGDVTRGLSGERKVWLAEHLRPAADTLAGVPLTKDHSPSVDDNVGGVVEAGYVEGEGIVFEAEVDDPEIAEKIENGRLEVSIEAKHGDGGEHADTGAMIATDIEFTALSIVQLGASPSNEVEDGPAQALAAALSPAEIRAALRPDDDADADADTEDAADAAAAAANSPPDDPDEGEVVGGPDSESTPADTEPMSDDESGGDDAPTIEELQAELGELREELAEVREERDALADENEQLADVADQAALEYAAALTDEDDPFTPEELADRYEVAELAAKYEDATDVTLTDDDAEPDVQSGDATEDEEEAVLAADRERIEQIDEKLSMLRHTLPEHRKAELRAEACELAGVDDYDAALEVL